MQVAIGSKEPQSASSWFEECGREVCSNLACFASALQEGIHLVDILDPFDRGTCASLYDACSGSYL